MLDFLPEQERNIFIYWDQGLDSAPPVVKLCVRQIRQLHPQWKIHELDARNISGYAGPSQLGSGAFDALPIQKQSNLYRMQLLLEHGGVWFDSTVFPVISLDSWLTGRMGEGVFLFQRPGPDRLVANWFMAARKGNRLLGRVVEDYCAYWRDNRFRHIGHPRSIVGRSLTRVLSLNLVLPLIWLSKPVTKLVRVSPYFAFHYNFYRTLRSDADLWAQWQRVPFLSAEPAHRLQRHGLGEPVTAEVREWLTQPISPVFKLSWKVTDGVKHNSVLEHLERVVAPSENLAVPCEPLNESGRARFQENRL